MSQASCENCSESFTFHLTHMESCLIECVCCERYLCWKCYGNKDNERCKECERVADSYEDLDLLDDII